MNDLSLMIYGKAGRGKTTLLSHLPEAKTAILSLENNKRLKDAGWDGYLSEIQNLTDFTASYETVKREGYKYICVDSLTALEKILQESMLKHSEREYLSMPEYTKAAQKMREIIRKLRNYHQHNNCIIIYTALELPIEISKSEYGVTTSIVPMLSKKLSLEITGLMDMIGRLIINEEGERELVFQNNNEFEAKSVFSVTKPAYQDPDLLGLLNEHLLEGYYA